MIYIHFSENNYTAISVSPVNKNIKQMIKITKSLKFQHNNIVLEEYRTRN